MAILRLDMMLTRLCLITMERFVNHSFQIILSTINASPKLIMKSSIQSWIQNLKLTWEIKKYQKAMSINHLITIQNIVTLCLLMNHKVRSKLFVMSKLINLWVQRNASYFKEPLIKNFIIITTSTSIFAFIWNSLRWKRKFTSALMLTKLMICLSMREMTAYSFMRNRETIHQSYPWKERCGCIWSHQW